ncbi:hypothetical protein HQ487_01960 [Candidatus Uhrbacteria bacterium]|nr:hypothetical protein [Candidatus Uhrbacteria bacterium]
MPRLSTLLLILSFISLAACGEMVSEDNATRTLTAEGWTEVTVTGKHGISPHYVGGCGEDDSVAFKASGLNPAGVQSTATVCCGLIVKSCTIRH